jgi:hypothetical protein
MGKPSYGLGIRSTKGFKVEGSFLDLALKIKVSGLISAQF